MHRSFISWRVAAALAALILAACAAAPSSRLADSQAPLRAVWVLASPGSFTGAGGTLPTALRPTPRVLTGIPETLQHNGVEVAAYRELTQPLRQIDQLERLWAEQPALHAKATHVLVLTAQRLKIQGLASSVQYEAVLWDTAGRRLVWKAAPVVGTTRGGPSEGELLAGEVLRALQRDGFVRLPQGHPTARDDRELPQQWQPLLQ